LREYHGGKFDHKLNLVLQSHADVAADQSLCGTSLSVTCIPQAVWPITFFNPLKTQVIPPALTSLTDSFIKSYKTKFEKRKLQFMAVFGSVDLVLDKKLHFSVSTG